MTVDFKYYLHNTVPSLNTLASFYWNRSFPMLHFGAKLTTGLSKREISQKHKSLYRYRGIENSRTKLLINKTEIALLPVRRAIIPMWTEYSCIATWSSAYVKVESNAISDLVQIVGIARTFKYRFVSCSCA